MILFPSDSVTMKFADITFLSFLCAVSCGSTAPLASLLGSEDGFSMLSGVPTEETEFTEVGVLEACITKLRPPVEAPGTSRFHRNR